MSKLFARLSCVLRDTATILAEAPGRGRILLDQFAFQSLLHLLLSVFYAVNGDAGGVVWALLIALLTALVVAVHYEVLRLQHRGRLDRRYGCPVDENLEAPRALRIIR